MTKRTALEVDVRGKPSCSEECNRNPLHIFAHMLRDKYGGSEESVIANKIYLEFLVHNNYISKTSIIWKDGVIRKIYGVKMNEDNKVYYDTTKKSPEKKNNNYITRGANVDSLAVRNAIAIATRQTSVP